MNILSLGMGLLGRLKYAPRFEKATKNPMQAQRELLFDLISKNKDTVYGKKYNFDKIKTIKDYQKYVPLNSWKDFEPYIEKIKNGEKNILYSEKTLFFSLTSGTTGQPKFIPYTPAFFAAMQDNVQTWFYYILKDHPRCFKGKLFLTSTPLKKEEITKGAIPYGSLSGFVVSRQPGFMKKFHAFPLGAMDKIKDYNSKYYTMMRFAIEKDISLFACVNPGLILLLVRKADQLKEEIIQDIEQGTISDKIKISGDIKEQLESFFTPNPERAGELRRLVQKRGHLFPKDYWPNLAIMALWKGGSMSVYLPQLPQYFGDVPMRDINYGGSEANCTVPIKDEGSDSVLHPANIFFEFIKEEDYGKKNPRVYTLDQIEAGQNYYIFTTNSAGLYRYNFEDVVQVVEKYNNTPTIKFLYKAKFFSNVTGEKLSEWQLTKTIEQAAREIGVSVGSYLADVEWKDATPYYVIYMKFRGLPSDQEKRSLIENIDQQLRKLNIEYEKRRESMRLAHPVLRIIEKTAYDLFHFQKLPTTRSDSQIKMPHFVSFIKDPDFVKKLQVIEEIKI